MSFALRDLAFAITGLPGVDHGTVTTFPTGGNGGDFARNTVTGALYICLPSGKWSQVLGPIGGAALVAALSAATPSATLNTNGTPVTGAPDTGFNSFTADGVDLVYASVGSETVTTSITVTFDDGTTSTAVTDTSTSSTTHHLDITALQSLRKSGHVATAVSVVVQSSINSSTATVTATVTGEEYR